MDPHSKEVAYGLAAYAFCFPFLFGGIWCAVCCLLAFGGGWQALARSYRAAGDFRGGTRDSESGSLGGVNYRWALSCGASADGLYLEINGLFRPGHPPLLIPWKDVHAERTKSWFGSNRVEFWFDAAKNPRLSVSPDLGGYLLSAAPVELRNVATHS
jgi:hypothetical protein